MFGHAGGVSCIEQRVSAIDLILTSLKIFVFRFLDTVLDFSFTFYTYTFCNSFEQKNVPSKNDFFNTNHATTSRTGDAAGISGDQLAIYYFKVNCKLDRKFLKNSQKSSEMML